MKKKRLIHFYLGMLPSLLLYTAFLFVQLFFNSEVQGSTGNKFSGYHHSRLYAEHTFVLRKKIQDKHHKSVIRLSKHFQYEKAVLCSTVTIVPVIYPRGEKQPGRYVTPFVSEASYPSRLLRGPPATAHFV